MTSGAGEAGGGLARYELLEVVSTGGFGTVHRARHKVTKRIVAIKLLSDKGRALGQDGADMVREARALAEIDHPNVVGVLDCGVEGDRAFVVMEFMTGQTLAAMLQERGPLSARDAVALVIQALEGLHAVHERGIVHRDVKPSNLMVDRRGTVKVVDFGLSITSDGAASWEAGRPPLIGAGTPGYMAPEQYDPGVALDARADIYSAAATLFRLLAGRLPFVGSAEEIRWSAVLSAAPPIASLVPNLPAHVANAVDRALARDRDARPPSALAFITALRGDAGASETSTLPAVSSDKSAVAIKDNSAPERAGPKARALGRTARRWTLAAGSLAVVAILGWAVLAASGASRMGFAPSTDASSRGNGASATSTTSARSPSASVVAVDDRPPGADAGLGSGAKDAAAPKAGARGRPRILEVAGQVLAPFGANYRPARAAFDGALPSLRTCAPSACLVVETAARPEPWMALSATYLADAEGRSVFVGVSGALPAGNRCPAFEACIASHARNVAFPLASRPGPFEFHLRVREMP